MTDPGIEDLLRELAPRVLGLLGRRYADFDGADDAVQEALVAAYQHWPARASPTTRGPGCCRPRRVG